MAIGDPNEQIGLGPILTYSQAQTGPSLCLTLMDLYLLYFYTDRGGLSPAPDGLVLIKAVVFKRYPIKSA